MGNYIDLTGKLENDMWGYHELPVLENIIPKVNIKPIALIKKDGFFSSSLTVASVSGTYVETGLHLKEGKKSLDKYSIQDFIKPVSIIHLPTQKPRARISSKILEKYAPKINRSEALIINTGWSSKWNLSGYLSNCPHYTLSAIDWILAKEITILGVDVPAMEDSQEVENADTTKGVLRRYFIKDNLLVAPLCNLEKIKSKYGILFCAPLYVEGTSGAPARIFLYEE